jgi:hypothetical protein
MCVLFPSIMSAISNSATLQVSSAPRLCYCHSALDFSPLFYLWAANQSWTFPYSIMWVLPLSPARFPTLLCGCCHSALDFFPLCYLGTATQPWSFPHYITWELPLNPGVSPLYYVVLPLSPGLFLTLLSGYCHSTLDFSPIYYPGTATQPWSFPTVLCGYWHSTLDFSPIYYLGTANQP